ncbi:CHASE3 domain-containing protein [Variovorax sp. HJSM1_2]|uniref:CHASE3 domain-containing protein n=1 Tax=Variovorax sp. HJSM1_2 TaxID=3366263 RepID=UPI003BC4C2F9
MQHPTGAHARVRSRLETLVLGGFIPSVLFVVVRGGLTYRANENFAETAKLVAHTPELRAELSRVYGALADAELARRNQMLTPDGEFAEVFQTRSDAAKGYLVSLARLILTTPSNVRGTCICSIWWTAGSSRWMRYVRCISPNAGQLRSAR